MDLVKILFRQRDTQRTRIPECDANGSVYVVNAAGVAQEVSMVDVAGDSCMDEVNNALQVNVVAGGAGGGIVTVADGGDVTQGANADAAITSDLAGTLSGKIRGLVKWAYERMPASLGQKTKLLSLPVTLASDEDALAVTGAFFQVTQPVSLAVAPSTPVTGPIDIEVGGVPPQLDDTDKIAVSVYGEDAAAGDTPLHVDGTYGARICHPNATSGTVDADPDTNNAPLTDVGNVLRYWVRNFVFNGTTWDRLRGDTSGVHVSAVPAALQGPGNPVVDSYANAVVNLAASGANQVLVAAPGANKQIWVYGLFMMADAAAGTVTLQDEDDTALSGTMAVSDEGGWVLPMSGNFAMPWVKVATNKALEADTGACSVDGILTYAVVSV